jgi:LacI family transcriptional regulator
MSRIRVREIARKLDLSPGTVSKALRGQSNLVSQVTAEKILGYCQAHSYMSKAEVDRVLFKMKAGTASKQIYVVTRRMGIEVYDAVFAGICQQMQDNGLVSSIFMANDVQTMGRFPYDKAGVAIVLGKSSPGVLEELTGKKVPTVLVDNRIAGLNFSAVNSNNLEAVRQAVRILAERGHKRIAFWCMHEDEPTVTYTFHERQTGYMAEMAALGLLKPELVVADYASDYQKGKFEPVKSVEMLRLHCQKLFRLDPFPTAVITANDLHAHVLREMLSEKGMRVPKDVSIIGYDGQHHLRPLSPHHFDPVSTMVVKWHEMGSVAVDLAMEFLYDPLRSMRFVELPAEFEDAGTVGIPRKS